MFDSEPADRVVPIMKRPILWPVLLLVGLMTVQSAVAAEDKKTSREREQIRKLQQAQMQLESDKTRLQQEKTQLEIQSKELAEESAKKEKALAAAAQRSSALSKQQDATRTELSQIQKKLEETSMREKDLSIRLASSDGENKKLQAALKTSQGEVNVCETKNEALYLHGSELLAKIDGQSALDKLLAKEPIFGIRRVEIENTVQEYRDKFDSGRLQRKTETKQ